MENKDSSIFSGHGKAIFSQIHASEVTTGNPNTEDEKKSKVEIKNQEENGNEEKNDNHDKESGPNSLETCMDSEIGPEKNLNYLTKTEVRNHWELNK